MAQYDSLDKGDEYLLKLKQGNIRTFFLNVKTVAGLPVDLSSTTAIYFTVKRSVDDADVDALISKDIRNSAGADLVNGKIAIGLVHADTASLDAGRYLWDLKLVGGTYDGHSIPEEQSEFVLFPAIRKT